MADQSKESKENTESKGNYLESIENQMLEELRITS